MDKKNLSIIIAVVVILVVCAGSFYGGMLYNKSKSKNPSFEGLNPGVSIRGNKQSGSMTSGEIISKDDKSITVKLMVGGSKIILFSSSTEVGKFVNGTADDLEIGKTVMVQGQTNNDGSVTAQSIQLRPAGETNLPNQQIPVQ